MTISKRERFLSHVLVLSVSFSIRDKFQLRKDLKAQTQGFSDFGTYALGPLSPVKAEKAKI